MARFRKRAKLETAATTAYEDISASIPYLLDINESGTNWTFRLPVRDLLDIPEITTFLESLGAELVVEAVSMIESSIPAGRVYGTHVASAPGQPPAVLSGELIENFIYFVQHTPYGVAMLFGNTSEHILYTEFGTVKMEPRPVIRPTVEEVLSSRGLAFSDAGV